MESALIALAAIFFLAHSAYFNNSRQKYRILTRRDKRESYLIADATMTHFIPLCSNVDLKETKQRKEKQDLIITSEQDYSRVYTNKVPDRRGLFKLDEQSSVL